MARKLFVACACVYRVIDAGQIEFAKFSRASLMKANPMKPAPPVTNTLYKTIAGILKAHLRNCCGGEAHKLICKL